jgi:hypothetical protein
LNGKNFLVKEPFNMLLKLMELREHFIFMFQEEDTCEFGIILYKAHIKFILSNRSQSRPHTSENTSLRGTFDTVKDLGKGS